ncbi:MAG: response regulator [Pseudomonadota bacterium]
MTARVLVLEDDDSLRLVVSKALARAGYEVRATTSPDTAIDKMIRREADILVADVLLGQENFLERIGEIRSARPDAPIIVMSAQTTADTAIDAAQGGAFEYLPKPFDLNDLSDCVARALEGAGGPARSKLKPALPGLIGRSRAMQDTFQALAKLTSRRDPVVFSGADGTGRASAARILHRARYGQGAALRELGPARLAHEGFAVFESLGEAGLLLRRAEAWNDLTQALVMEAVEEGGPALASRLYITADDAGLSNLRPVLLNAIAIGRVHLPRLQEREGDVRLLFEHFQAETAGGKALMLEAAAWDVLLGYGWPGDVLELKAVARHLSAQNPNRIVTSEQVRRALQVGVLDEGEKSSRAAKFDVAASELAAEALATQEDAIAELIQARLDAALIRTALKATGGVRREAADRLGLNRNTLARRIRTLGLDEEDG